MKNSKQILSIASGEGITRREGLMLTVLGSALALAGCGGGGGGGGTAPTGGTIAGSGSSTTGAITGFGSIIVGGVRYDDSAASVSDDDGATRSSGDLKLGMVVMVKGGKKSDDGVSIRANANTIEVYSELLGPIDAITGTSMQVLGQTVTTTPTTVFEDGLTLAALKSADVVEVYGFVDPLNKTMVATRVERETKRNAFKLQGAISGLNTATKTFSIGTLTISYLTADLPAGLTLADKLVVRVRLAINPLTGTRTALKIRTADNRRDDADEAEVEGIITALTSTSRFSVNGLPVDASAATFKNGTTGLVVGARVEVEGRVVNGVLMATKVKLEKGEDDKYKFELHGLVSALDKTARTFMVRGVSVTYSNTTTLFKNGATLVNLANGNNVEIKGVLSNGNIVTATEISLEK
ncbi:DUF5666 domain-containing protein [Polaromonas sp.]|jgi:hypothetical protein|uniref:DUF5666 domain-containing protein n=1 Tax=Polaromonas sp. TaxID=1869339 RepID=UPI000BD01BB2|nr:DUF5666 domain-containing protein [Polaromonas sp.]OYZ03269.1 MAG: hypothetical protein B7Y42_01325 [Polaromonas sp. 28-63-22]HQS32099.1 DUF5666 domain-containing protein [Polaromonas sp.]HQS90535.1 DUF5666 domain-containing protein [Polaromonas sp.]